MKLTICIIITLTIISCNGSEEKKINGNWTIELIEKNGQDLMFQYTSNLISFKKGRTCTLPQTRENGNNVGTWALYKAGGIYYIKIEAGNNNLTGSYKIDFENDNENKLLKVHLSTDSINIICSKLLNKFER